MSGNMTPERCRQEAVERHIGTLNDCFDETPEDRDLDRRDYRVLAKETREVKLINADGSYIDPIGVVAYVQPHFPQVYGTR